MILELTKLTKRFGGLNAINNVSFRVDRGEIVGLIGPNGAGKTTLFSLMTGFYLPDAGDIKYNNESIVGLRPHKICQKGIVRTFQIVQPYQEMSVLENVLVGSLIHNCNVTQGKMEAAEILDWIGLADKKDIITHNLNLADRRRLELAKTLATKPQVLLLDEVMSGLNPKELGDMVEIIRNIAQKEVTLIIVEHVMRAIISLATRIIVLHYGEKIADGTSTEILSNPQVVEAYLGK